MGRYEYSLYNKFYLKYHNRKVVVPNKREDATKYYFKEVVALKNKKDAVQKSELNRKRRTTPTSSGCIRIIH